MSNAVFTSTRSVIALLLVALVVVLFAPLLLFDFGMGSMGGWRMGPWMMDSDGDGGWMMPWAHDGWMMGPWTHGSWMMGSGMGASWFGLLAFALMLLVPIALLLVFGYLAYRLVASASTETGRDPALDELRTAYARGDLSDEEFEHRREQLRRTN